MTLSKATKGKITSKAGGIFNNNTSNKIPGGILPSTAMANSLAASVPKVINNKTKRTAKKVKVHSLYKYVSSIRKKNHQRLE